MADDRPTCPICYRDITPNDSEWTDDPLKMPNHFIPTLKGNSPIRDNHIKEIQDSLILHETQNAIIPITIFTPVVADNFVVRPNYVNECRESIEKILGYSGYLPRDRISLKDWLNSDSDGSPVVTSPEIEDWLDGHRLSKDGIVRGMHIEQIRKPITTIFKETWDKVPTPIGTITSLSGSWSRLVSTEDTTDSIVISPYTAPIPLEGDMGTWEVLSDGMLEYAYVHMGLLGYWQDSTHWVINRGGTAEVRMDLDLSTSIGLYENNNRKLVSESNFGHIYSEAKQDWGSYGTGTFDAEAVCFNQNITRVGYGMSDSIEPNPTPYSGNMKGRYLSKTSRIRMNTTLLYTLGSVQAQQYNNNGYNVFAWAYGSCTVAWYLEIVGLSANGDTNSIIYYYTRSNQNDTVSGPSHYENFLAGSVVVSPEELLTLDRNLWDDLIADAIDPADFKVIDINIVVQTQSDTYNSATSYHPMLPYPYSKTEIGATSLKVIFDDITITNLKV